MVLGSFYYGFIITQIPGGILSEKFGAKWMIWIMTSLAGILTLFNPLAARNGGIGVLAALRVLQGLVQVSHASTKFYGEFSKKTRLFFCIKNQSSWYTYLDSFFSGFAL